MGEVIPLKRPKRQTVRGAARALLTDALDHVGTPTVVVIYTQNAAGKWAVRTAHVEGVHLYDALSRAEGAINRDKAGFVECDDGAKP